LFSFGQGQRRFDGNLVKLVLDIDTQALFSPVLDAESNLLYKVFAASDAFLVTLTKEGSCIG
jgi:hypothetical protein